MEENNIYGPVLPSKIINLDEIKSIQGFPKLYFDDYQISFCRRTSFSKTLESIFGAVSSAQS